MQHAPIGGERLERAGRAAGSDQRNQIGRLELTVDEGVEGSPSVLQAFNRQPQVVDDERQRPLDVATLGRRGRYGRSLTNRT